MNETFGTLRIALVTRWLTMEDGESKMKPKTISFGTYPSVTRLEAQHIVDLHKNHPLEQYLTFTWQASYILFVGV